MIFVTVGTHEQQFNRLIKSMDNWAKSHDEEVIMQTGYSTYEPKYAKWQKLFSYKEMDELVNNARIVITHGGPSSFIAPLQKGKIPIVVPRQAKYDEHVNDHQLEFCKQVKVRQENIIVVENIDVLDKEIDNYTKNTNLMRKEIEGNNKYFCKEFDKIANILVKK